MKKKYKPILAMIPFTVLLIVIWPYGAIIMGASLLITAFVGSVLLFVWGATELWERKNL